MSGTPEDVPPAVRIEAANEWAWRGTQRLQLTPKAFAVLRHLVDHAGRLVTKDELFATVWRDAVVGDATLTSCIRDLRDALADSPRTPRYIETVHRRGFRFIGPVATAQGGALGRNRSSAPTQRVSTTVPTLVGRDAELARLQRLLERAASGERNIVFVTGEPGIGKTALVEAFLSQMDAGDSCRIARGQCIEQYGAGEAYLPMLEAVGRLGREAGGEDVGRILKQYAPTWLMQLPALLADQDLEWVQRRVQGATRERMLRELVEALEVLSRDELLVLVLEDLHWSDSSTIDLLARVARRLEPARLLVLGTYRPADVVASAHPLRPVQQELEVHGQCEQIVLDFLSLAAIGEYLAQRFPGHRFPPELAGVVHRNTDGNPLVVVNTVDYLIAQGHIRQVDGRWELSSPVREIAFETPDTLAQIVEKQATRLTAAEQQMLSVACVAGAEFSAAVAAAGDIDLHEGERLCAELAQRGQFLRATGLAEWPDGTVAGRYAFIHALYRNVLYERVSIGQRVGLHLRTGELLERGYGQRAGDVAGELAMHFEHGRDLERAVRYRTQAAEHALRRHGYREAADHVTRALDVLTALPASDDRSQQELMLQMMLGSALAAVKGHAVPEVEQAYGRAHELCEKMDDTPRLFPVLLGLGWFYLLRGSADGARDVGHRLLTIAEETGAPAIRLAGHMTSGLMSFYVGEFEGALDHVERGIALYDPTAHSPTRSSAFRIGLDPGGSCISHAAWALWVLGYPARAAERIREMLALARSLNHPFSLAHAHRFAAAFYLCRRERDAVQEHAAASIALATEQGFGAVLAAASVLRGWALVEQGRSEEGLASMQQGVTVCRQIRAEALIPAYFCWLAELTGKIGRPEEGLALVNEALDSARQSRNHYWTAELLRLKGTLTLQSVLESTNAGATRTRRGSAASAIEKEAESSFLEALTTARRQHARLFELRVATSLSRLWASQRKRREAHALLAEAFGWFTEGFDTADLVEARAVLQELSTSK